VSPRRPSGVSPAACPRTPILCPRRQPPTSSAVLPPHCAADRDAVSPVTNHGADFGCLCCLSPPAHNNVSVSLVTVTRPPVRIAHAVNPAAAAPCAACVPRVGCPRCVSPRRTAWRGCCCNRYGRSVRGPGAVPREFQSAAPVECPQPDGPPAACPIPVCVPE